LPAETQLGLYLNLDREIIRDSLSTTIGIAGLLGQMDESYFSAFTNTEDEAKIAAMHRRVRK
jgi:hypothetical protein